MLKMCQRYSSDMYSNIIQNINRRFVFLNMFENSVSIKSAVCLFSFDSDTGKCNFKISPRSFLTELIDHFYHLT